MVYHHLSSYITICCHLSSFIIVYPQVWSLITHQWSCNDDHLSSFIITSSKGLCLLPHCFSQASKIHVWRQILKVFFTDGVSRLSFHVLHVLTRCVGTQHRCFDKAFLVFLKHFTAFSQCVVGLFHGNQTGIFNTGANKNTIKTSVNTSGVKAIQFSVWRSMINKSGSLDAMSLNVSKNGENHTVQRCFLWGNMNGNAHNQGVWKCLFGLWTGMKLQI